MMDVRPVVPVPSPSSSSVRPSIPWSVPSSSVLCLSVPVRPVVVRPTRRRPFSVRPSVPPHFGHHAVHLLLMLERFLAGIDLLPARLFAGLFTGFCLEDQDSLHHFAFEYFLRVAESNNTTIYLKPKTYLFKIQAYM